MCSCQRTGPGLSCPGMQPRAIDAGKLFCKWIPGPARLSTALRHFDAPFFAPREMVGVNGVEPLTPRLSSACSNQLSYTPNGSLERVSVKASERGNLHAFTLYA